MADVGEQRKGPPTGAVRRALASAGSLATALVFARLLHGDRLSGVQWLTPLMLTSAPVVAAASIWSRRIALQLLARGFWWSFLLLGGLVCVLLGNGGAGPAFGCHLAVTSAFSLLVAGTIGLGEDGGRFRPAAFRGTLMLALVLAIADSATLLWFGTMQAVEDRSFRILLLLPPMIAGVVGLLQLRTWGLLVSLACNVAVAALAAAAVLDLPPPLRWMLVATAILQLLVPVPMWISIARRRGPPPDRWRRAKRIVSTVVIAGIAALSLFFTYVYERRVW